MIPKKLQRYDEAVQGKIINTTKSLCHLCYRMIDACIVERNGHLFLQKTCPEHGTSEVLHFLENEAYFHRTHTFLKRSTDDLLHCRAVLVVDITYQCNLDCKFCYAQANQRKEPDPSLEEILTRIEGFTGAYIYLGGGEPTLREDLFEIIHRLKIRGYHVVLMTNGLKLVEPGYVDALKRSGVDCVQLQFDTLNDEQYVRLTGEQLLTRRLQAFENLKRASIPVFLWAKLVRGINDDQAAPLIRFVAEHAAWVKYLIIVDAWREGRTEPKEDYVTRTEIWDTFKREWGITIDDFLAYMEFDYYMFVIHNIVKRKVLERSTPCSSRCHCFYIDGHIVPLTRLMDLSRVNPALALTVSRMKGRKHYISKIFQLLRYFPYLNFVMSFMRCRALKGFILKNALYFMPFFRRGPLNRNNNSFTLVIGPYMDRYDFDFELAFAHCHMPVMDTQGNFVPFCFKEIMWGRELPSSAYREAFFNSKKRPGGDE